MANQVVGCDVEGGCQAPQIGERGAASPILVVRKRRLVQARRVCEVGLAPSHARPSLFKPGSKDARRGLQSLGVLVTRCGGA